MAIPLYSHHVCEICGTEIMMQNRGGFKKKYCNKCRDKVVDKRKKEFSKYSYIMKKVLTGCILEMMYNGHENRPRNINADQRSANQRRGHKNISDGIKRQEKPRHYTNDRQGNEREC